MIGLSGGRRRVDLRHHSSIAVMRAITFTVGVANLCKLRCVRIGFWVSSSPGPMVIDWHATQCNLWFFLEFASGQSPPAAYVLFRLLPIVTLYSKLLLLAHSPINAPAFALRKTDHPLTPSYGIQLIRLCGPSTFVNPTRHKQVYPSKL